MTPRKRYRNPSPPGSSGSVPVEEVTLTGRRGWPKRPTFVKLTPAAPPPTEVTLPPQGAVGELADTRRSEVRAALALFEGALLEKMAFVWDALDEPARRRATEVVRERVVALESALTGRPSPDPS